MFKLEVLLGISVVSLGLVYLLDRLFQPLKQRLDRPYPLDQPAPLEPTRLGQASAVEAMAEQAAEGLLLSDTGVAAGEQLVGELAGAEAIAAGLMEAASHSLETLTSGLH